MIFSMSKSTIARKRDFFPMIKDKGHNSNDHIGVLDIKTKEGTKKKRSKGQQSFKDISQKVVSFTYY